MNWLKNWKPERRVIIDYKRKSDGHIYSVSYPISSLLKIEDDGTTFHLMSQNKLWEKSKVYLEK